MAAKKYNLAEVEELWRQEPDDKKVFRAATEDIEEYPPEIQAVIKDEAKRRREAVPGRKISPKQSLSYRFWSSIGIYYDPKQSWLKKTCTILVCLIVGVIAYLFAKETVKSFFVGRYLFGIIGVVVFLYLLWPGFRHKFKKPKDQQKE